VHSETEVLPGAEAVVVMPVAHAVHVAAPAFAHLPGGQIVQPAALPGFVSAPDVPA
jgi:hypothetical protein